MAFVFGVSSFVLNYNITTGLSIIPSYLVFFRSDDFPVILFQTLYLSSKAHWTSVSSVELCVILLVEWVDLGLFQSQTFISGLSLDSFISHPAAETWV